MESLLDAGLVFLLGAAIGFTELISRYRDAPFLIASKPPGLLYIALNGFASLTAWGLTQVFGWNFGVTSGGEALRWTQVLVSGLGAMTLFRSSLFTVRVGNQDMGIGPSSVLTLFFDAIDREVDRMRAKDRAQRVIVIMKDVVFTKAYDTLPSFALALMQNLSEEDQKAFAQEINDLGQSPTNDQETKSLLLGLVIINFLGEDVLVAAVDSLGTRIRTI